MVKFRLVVLLFACLSLCGCASLQLMSWGISGISYVTTGKSISDHAISTVLKKDCALHRTILGEETCIDHDGEGVIRGVKPGEYPTIAKEDNWQMVASSPSQTASVSQYVVKGQLPPINRLLNAKVHLAENFTQILPDNDEPKVTPQFIRTSVSPDQTVRELMAKQNHQQTAKDNNQMVEKSSPYVDKPALYAVVGSYNNKHFAQNNIIKQAKHSKIKAKLMVNSAQSINQGAPKYRVLIGPLSSSQFATSLGDVGESAHHKAWRMTLCQQTLLPPPCESNMFAANRQR